MQWYYSKNGTQLGPVEEGELRAKLAAGEISTTDLVWKDGMPDWQPAAKVAELAQSAFPTARPVIPQVPAGNSPYAPPVHGGYAGGIGPAPTSGLAIASLICGIVGLFICFFLPSIPAVICGHMALNQISQSGTRVEGRGLAISGLILGYLSIVIFAVMMFFIIFSAVGASHSAGVP